MTVAASTPARRLTQAERTEISDQRMFEATVNLIVENGTAATSLKEVGERAGYSRGLAGHRFGNKDALFSFVVRRLGEIWLAQLKLTTTGATGFQAIEKALEQHYQFCVDAPQQVQTFYTLWFESVNTSTELSEAIQGIHRRRHADVVAWINQCDQISASVKQSSDAIAAQFSASVIGIVYYWLANPSDLNLARTLHDGLKLTMSQLLSEKNNEELL